MVWLVWFAWSWVTWSSLRQDMELGLWVVDLVTFNTGNIIKRFSYPDMIAYLVCGEGHDEGVHHQCSEDYQGLHDLLFGCLASYCSLVLVCDDQLAREFVDHFDFEAVLVLQCPSGLVVTSVDLEVTSVDLAMTSVGLEVTSVGRVATSEGRGVTIFAVVWLPALSATHWAPRHWVASSHQLLFGF